MVVMVHYTYGSHYVSFEEDRRLLRDSVGGRCVLIFLITHRVLSQWGPVYGASAGFCREMDPGSQLGSSANCFVLSLLRNLTSTPGPTAAFTAHDAHNERTGGRMIDVHHLAPRLSRKGGHKVSPFFPLISS